MSSESAKNEWLRVVGEVFDKAIKEGRKWECSLKCGKDFGNWVAEGDDNGRREITITILGDGEDYTREPPIPVGTIPTKEEREIFAPGIWKDE